MTPVMNCGILSGVQSTAYTVSLATSSKPAPAPARAVATLR
jgi:hypothetical protein